MPVLPLPPGVPSSQPCLGAAGLRGRFSCCEAPMAVDGDVGIPGVRWVGVPLCLCICFHTRADCELLQACGFDVSPCGV